MMCFADAVQTMPSWEYLAQWGPALPLLVMVGWFADRWLRRLDARAKEIRDALVKIEVHHAERHEELMSEVRDVAASVCTDDGTRRRRRRPPPPEPE